MTKHNPTIRDIDLAWERINAMGGVPCCAHDEVYNLAIGDCLRIIESLGGYDPAARRHARKAELVASPAMRAEDMLPFQPGDQVRHRSTGEIWTVKRVVGGNVEWCGWPPGCAKVDDCELAQCAPDASAPEMRTLAALNGDDTPPDEAA